MNIKSSLTLKFTLIVAAIFLTFSGFIYKFSSDFRDSEFRERFENVSRKVVKSYFEHEEITPDILRFLYKNKINRFTDERLIIADFNHEVVFASEAINDREISLLKDLYSKGESGVLINGKRTYITYMLIHEENPFFVVCSAVDLAGYQKLEFLGYLLLIMSVGIILIAALSGWYFANQALQPINKVVSEVDSIHEENLFQRVSEGKGKDEIASLAQVFNKMLGRLEKSFIARKLFVSNASHEFKTPLTSMKGQIEVLLLHERSNEEYKKSLHSLLEDVQKLIALINGLSDLAKADFPNKALMPVSIVELLMDVREDLLKLKKDYQIKLNWKDFPENEMELMILSDESLLKSAFMNLMDNACKFSPGKSCDIQINFFGPLIRTEIRDEGPGIRPEEIPFIFDPFYRSNETRHVQGYGIGLSLVKKTIDIHKGEIQVNSVPGKGTRIVVILPSMINDSLSKKDMN